MTVVNYYMINNVMKWSISENKIVFEDINKNSQITLHGNLTSKYLIPNLNKLKIPRQITELWSEANKELIQFLDKLVDKKILIKFAEKELLGELSYKDDVYSNKVLVISNFYTKQFDNFLKDLTVANVTYFLMDIDGKLAGSIKHKIDAKCKTVLIQGENEIRNKLFTQVYDVIISFHYGLMNDYRNWYVNRILDEYAVFGDTPVIYANQNFNECLVGPTYIPKKTASFCDFCRNHVDYLIEEERNFVVNPLLCGNTINLVSSEVRWVLFQLGRPMLINKAVYTNQYDVRNKFQRIYRYGR